MTLTFGFYDSVSSDRVYNALQMSSIFDGIIEDGVFASIGDKLLVTENTTPSLHVLVGSGRAWFNHTWNYNDADVTLAVSTPDALLPRIDTVYLEVNQDTGVRANSFGIAAGTPASTPVPPTLTETSTVHQHALANVYVAAAATQITDASITNLVGTAVTPFVTGPLSLITTDEILTQWEAEWDEWFQDIIDQLSTEAETNLQNQIWDLAGVVSGAPPYADDMVSLASHDHSGSHPQIPSGGLGSFSVTEGKIAAGAVTNSKLGLLSVADENLQIGAVSNTKLASNAVSQSKMQTNSVGTAQIINGSITTGKLANNSVDTNHIIDDAITEDKLPNRTRRIWIPATACNFNGSWQTDNAMIGAIFPDTSSTTKLIGSIGIITDKISGGSTLKIYWKPATSNLGVRINLYDWPWTDGDYVKTDAPHNFTELTITPQSSLDDGSVSSIATVFPGVADILSFQFWRDHDHAEDLNTGDIYVYGFMLEYTAIY